MRLARCLASWLVHTSTSKGRGRGQGLTPYPPTLRVARHQAAYPLPPYPKCPDATLPYPPGVPNPAWLVPRGTCRERPGGSLVLGSLPGRVSVDARLALAIGR